MNRTVLLAAVDGTPTSDVVVRSALAMARSFAGAELHLVYVAEPVFVGAALPTLTLSELLEDGQKLLAGVSAQAAEAFPGRVISHVVVDLPAAGILQVATDIEADLIIVGCHGQSLLRRLTLGSVSRAVSDHAHCAVLIARPPAYPKAVVPTIEPACPQCLAKQKASAGAELWCAQHTRRALQPHLHYRVAEPFAVGSEMLRPDATE